MGADRFAVLSRAVSGNSTVGHVIRTAFYQNAYGIAPRCAVYYVGPHEKWRPFIDLKDLHRLLAHLRSVLKREAAGLSDVVVEDDNRRLDDSHFIEAEHFSAKGAKAFATMIAPAIAEACGSSM